MATRPVGPSKSTSALSPTSAVNSSQGLKISLTELNPHFVCFLCFGYFVDATTITECMHTFCKSCIVNFLQTNHHCPHCDTMLSRTRPFNSLRPDRMMQNLVYKTVPGLFQTEMRRRIQFYQSHPYTDFEPDVKDIQNYVFSPEDSVSLSIRYYNATTQITGDDLWDTGGSPGNLPVKKTETMEEDDINAIRYFRCPATVPMSVLKALVKTKYGIPDPFRVELLYGEERLLDSWTLMEVAYIFKWNRETPMELSFQVFVTRKVKRKRLRLVRKTKVKDEQSGGSPSVDDSAGGMEEDEPSKEPPHKIPRLEGPHSHFESSPEEHHQRPPTPPETPDGPIDINLCTDHRKSPKTPSWFPSPSRDDPHSLKIILKSKDIRTKICSSDSNKTASSEDDDSKDNDNSTQSAFDVFEKSNEEEGTSKFQQDDTRSDQDDNLDNDDCTMNDDGDSGDCAGDQDSEAPLEVDTSHETEPEADNDGDTDYGQGDVDSYKHSIHKDEDMDEDEQGDSAIDVTETSASEIMDSDEKDTDFNMSSESLDMETHGRKVCEQNSTLEKKGRTIKSEGCFSDNDNNKESKEESSEADMSGALDLSCHARTVRAQRENSQSPVSGNSPSENDAKIQGLQALLAASQNGANNLSSDGSTLHGHQSPHKTSSCLIPGTNLLTNTSVGSPRPTLPLNWGQSPIGNGPVPHAAAFNLMTLSHAAVQLQLAMAHAQAQAQAHQAQVKAQAQVQAQAQKIQAQVQANVLKNLKATETLSFVNGSGDTLTISPIPCNQGTSTKSKLSSKGKTVKNQNNLNYNKSSSSKHKLVNNQKVSKSSKDIRFQNGGSSVDKSENNNSNKNNHSQNVNAISSNNNNHSSSNNSVFSNQENNNSLKTPQQNLLKTVIPKSALTSLRIPTVSLSSKGHVSKSEREKKLDEKEKERTGDPVFKITNQKLIEFVRQQHLHKLKQSNKQNTTSDGMAVKPTNNSSSEVSNVSTKPTLAVVPTSISDNVNQINKNCVTNKPQTSNIPSKPLTNPTTKLNLSSQNKVASPSPVSKTQPTTNKQIPPNLSKPQQQSSLNKPLQPSLNKPQSTNLNKPLQQNINKPLQQNINKPLQPNLNKPLQQNLNKPLQQNLNKPQLTNLIKPQSPGLNKSPTHNLSKPQSPSLSKPQPSNLNKPQPNGLNKTQPPSPSLNKSMSPNLAKPHSHANKTAANLSKPILSRSPMISLNKISVNPLNRSVSIPSTKSPTTPSFAGNPISSMRSPVSLNGTSTSQSNGEVLQPKPSAVNTTPKQLTLTSSVVTSTANTVRTTNTNVRQIPNPSRLTHQAENRISAAAAAIPRLGLLSKKGVTSSKSEGMSRIESLTRSLHEKVAAASAGVGATAVLNSLAR